MCKFCGFDNGFLHHAAMVVVVLVLTTNVVSAVPAAPTIPSEFRTTFNVSQRGNQIAHVRSWYDGTDKKQRFDIFNEDSFGWTSTFNRYDLSTPMQYNLTRSLNNWICMPGKLTVPMLAPNFLSSTKYTGTGTVNNNKVNNWQDTTGRVWSTLVAKYVSVNVRFPAPCADYLLFPALRTLCKWLCPTVSPPFPSARSTPRLSLLPFSLSLPHAPLLLRLPASNTSDLLSTACFKYNLVLATLLPNPRPRHNGLLRCLCPNQCGVCDEDLLFWLPLCFHLRDRICSYYFACFELDLDEP